MSHFKPTSALVEPPRAEIPQVKAGAIHVELFGVDVESFFHVGFCSNRISDAYEQMHEEMEEATRGDCIPTHHLKKIGLYCIAEHCGRRGGIFARAKVTSVNFDTNPETVSLHLIDDFMDVDLPRTRLFPINVSILQYPLFSLKCKLDQMDCFLGNPFLKTVYEEHMKSGWKPGSRRCTIKFLDNYSVPTVQLTSSVWSDVTAKFQESVPVLSRMNFPEPNKPTLVRVVNVSKTGKVWYQAHGKDHLIRVIKSRMNQLSHGLLKKNHELAMVDRKSWKNYYFNGAGEIYIAQNRNDLQYYRVRLLKRNYDFTANVNFIDYGFSARVLEKTMIPAHWYDPNLSFIAPQCLAIKLTGTDDNNDANPFDMCRFWKYIGCEAVNIVMRDYGLGNLSGRLKGLIVPEADILVRSDRCSRDDPGYSVHALLSSSSSSSSPKKVDQPQELKEDEKRDDNGVAESKTSIADIPSWDKEQLSSEDEDSLSDSAFCSFDFDDLELDDAYEIPNFIIKGTVKPVSTLAASYFRQLRLLDKI